LELGTDHAKTKAFLDKRSRSGSVKNDLIYVQQSIKHREIQRIGVMTARQKELLGVVERNRRQRELCEQTYQQFQTLPFEQVYPSLRQRAKRSSSRRSSLRSESLFFI
jgi:hypothetical protein